MAPSLKRSLEDTQSSSEKEEDVKKAVSGNSFIPRSYQLEIFEVALRRNTIAVLDTGAGKTMIAVMLMEEIWKETKSKDDIRVIIFMAPTVHLVNQQFEVIKVYTNFKVAEYYGAKGTDQWNATHWEKDIESHKVLVMTPQILLDALRTAFITLDMVELMIFDECHRASGNHPYARIMRDFYHKSSQKPKIFGMTASPLVRKGVSSAMDCEDQLSELECMLDSKICMVNDRTQMEQAVPSAQEINWYYNPMVFLHEGLKEKLKSSWLKYDDLVAQFQESRLNQFKDTADHIKKCRKKLSKYHAKILQCLDDLGLICAHEAAQDCIEIIDATNRTDGNDFSLESFVPCKNFLKEILQIVEETLPHDFFRAEYDCSLAVNMGYISPKLHELIQISQSFGGSKETLCLIFVERIITAKVIVRFMRKFNYLSHLTFSYLTGRNSSEDALTPHMQRSTLDLFRSGKVNLLFTTDVAEEGIDVHNCSCVIRFDLPKTTRSYVQSRGRARQLDSRYILLIERGNISQMELLFGILRSEHSVIDTTLNRDHNTLSSITKMYHNEDTNVYCVDSTKATVTPDSSITLIQKYCEKLPKDKYFSPKPMFQCSSIEASYRCTLTLPPNAAFQTIVGPASRNPRLSRQLVCLEACKKLHKMGALDDHLLPSNDSPSKTELREDRKESTSGAGTTKRKELHGTTKIHALSGTWAHEPIGVTFQAYRVSFSCDRDTYSDFVLLLEATLADDVAHIEVDLFLVRKMVKSSISPCGQIHFDADQVNKAKLFQEFFFTGLFGKLFVGSKPLGVERKLFLKMENQSLWNKKKMYLLLPADTSSHEMLSFDWRAIYSCYDVVGFLNNISVHVNCDNKAEDKNKFGMIQLANKSVHFSQLKGVVVVAFHTGRIYSIVDVLLETSAGSPFDSDSGPSVYSSFTEYFSNKYTITLKHPGQPLLLLKQSHNAHNLLCSRSKLEDAPKGKRGSASGKDIQVAKPQAHVRMPPELLLSIDVPIGVLKSFYLLPSFMHRLESLMLASQLREEIASHTGSCHIPASLILEAITSQRCCEDFSLERLELLGDSVLKCAVSCYLFLKYPDKHEGQLSSRRSLAVCNSSLHKLGINCKLQGYIRDAAFEPRRWLAPGQLTIFPVPCRCGVDTPDVPFNSRYASEDISIVVGKACDMGHRWICSKTIADSVEALIGAYFVGGGLSAALSLMKWLGIDAELELQLVEQALRSAEGRCNETKTDVIEALESKLGYKFEIKGLLLEAVTHASQQELGAAYCYQRLEFLGDSVLDLLITRYLFQTHTDVDPGELTDLRSASVNNESFAQAAVKHNLQQHLQHASGHLLAHISEYAKYITKKFNNEDPQPQLLQEGSKGPKVLGDLVESIAGAVLIDTRIDLEKVWEVFKPLLSPIITPDKLELPPFRELIELCSHVGYFLSQKCTSKEDMVVAELAVQLKDVLLVRHGKEKKKKDAKGQAAVLLLKDLEERGITHAKRKHCEESTDGFMHAEDFEAKDPNLFKKQKVAENPSPLESLSDSSLSKNCKLNDRTEELSEPPCVSPVAVSLNMTKGGPRIALYDLCKKLQWPLPMFQESRDQRKGFFSFVSTVMLHIPNFGAINLTGERRADKKSSQDAAALVLLHELENRGRCIIKVL